MKKLYSQNISLKYLITIAIIILGNLYTANGQIIVPFKQRTSTASPLKTIYSINGDFTMIGNTNLKLQNYSETVGNGNRSMEYVDIDSDSNTWNSSSSTLAFSSENGADPNCSKIIYAGLYWTGRAPTSENFSSDTFTLIRNDNSRKSFDKKKISLKGPKSNVYTEFTAKADDIYYPTTSDGFMYSAYAEVTDYVKLNGLGEYFGADIALRNGNGGATGYYGGWSLIVVYENSKMKNRDVTIFDGHAYVAGGTTTNFELPVSGFNAVEKGAVGIKLGLIAGEGDVDINGDYFQIKKKDGSFTSLSHSGNSADNFFNSSIDTGGNARTPSLKNNTGLDISMFNVPNANNAVIGNSQTSTTFKYGSTQDTYVIFAIAMAIDAYVPKIESQISLEVLNGNNNPNVPYSIKPGQDMEYKVDIKNLGTEALKDTKVVIPIPVNTTYVANSATGDIKFSPSPNTISYDSTLGANGSLVWNLGTLPLPDNPNKLLASLTFKLRATEDCMILRNSCNSTILVGGSSSATGATTGIKLVDSEFIKGYNKNGASCAGEPITEPISIAIDATDFVSANCNNTPSITGVNVVCIGSTTTFSNTVSSGTWSSASPLVATVNASTGVITGVSVGTAVINYSVKTSGCTITSSRTVTVSAPVAQTVSGTNTVCVGNTTTFSSTTSGGTWTSATPAVATVNPTTGVVTGVSAGTSLINYSVTTTGGCVNTASRTVTVSAPIAQTVSGTNTVCIGSTTTFSSTTSGGTWTSATPTVATVDSSTGVVTGVSAGTSLINYSVTTTGGCVNTASRTVTVSAPVAQTVSGTNTVCVGNTTTFSSTTSGGTWTSATPTVATVDSSTGVVTGVSAG
ncbi:hypothetical protein, partial [Flavobacterium frigidarium]